jgi:hypothetical protein
MSLAKKPRIDGPCPGPNCCHGSVGGRQNGGDPWVTASLILQVPAYSALLQNLGINTSVVITNPKPKHEVIVSDLRLNPTSMRVPIHISQVRERDATNLALGGGSHCSPLALLDKVEDRRLLLRIPRAR